MLYAPCASHRIMSQITLPLWLLALFDFTFPAHPPPMPCNEPQPLRFCFFGFDRLRFDWSSSNRFGGYGGCRGRLFFYFFLTGTGRVSQCFWRFTWITVHFLGFASYLFALLLFREEPLRGLKNLCSLLCLKKRRKQELKTLQHYLTLPKPVKSISVQTFIPIIKISFP